VTREKRHSSTDLPLLTTTLWDYPSQNYRGGKGSGQGDTKYVGATPSYVIWNLLQRYTQPKWLVVDPMAGSGTTLDVARDLDRRALGYDVRPMRDDIFRVDARKLPLESEKADFIFVDPPYSNHIEYSGLPECIGTLDAREGLQYYQAMEEAIGEMHRVLKPNRHLALYICDSAKKGRPIEPLGFEVFARLRRYFVPVDIIAVARHNRTLKRDRWHEAASDGNFYLRGFNYLFIMYKEKKRRSSKSTPKGAPTRGKRRR
jgi:adenine-specific DNA-methyltransferase